MLQGSNWLTAIPLVWLVFIHLALSFRLALVTVQKRPNGNFVLTPGFFF